MTASLADQATTRNERPRRRLPEDWSVSDFIKWADANDIKYVVLRWFEGLPDLPDGDDLDILVADESVEKVLEVTKAKSVSGIPCDVYSVSGRMGTKYKGVPYYPPHLAEQILADAVRYNGIVPAPSREHYFLSLAYHAVYHKGRRSDLSPSLEARRESESTSLNSHFAKLSSLRDELGLDVPVHFAGLAEFLRERSWEPGLDLMRKLGKSNGWVKKLCKDRVAARKDIPGLSVFVLRNWAVRKGWVPAVLARLQLAGFVVLLVQELSGERHDAARRHFRGGNWGASAEYPVNSGGPAMLIAVFDRSPRPVNKKDRRRYPDMTNGRIIKVKREIRQMMNERRSPDKLVNSLHTSDDEAEAAYYLEIVAPEALPSIRKLASSLLRGRDKYSPRLRTIARRVLPRRVRRALRVTVSRMGVRL